jgi:nitroimidazol reductase NimA-like FMN-containing flavoprotein (pyridoxamine 5'-phosphate oxidase superfamily)/N-acetylglutamate synthase-like GNAT family acetyltransferase
MQALRRAEFADSERATAWEVLDEARYAQVATVAPDGTPEVRPLNYARVEETLYLHCAEKGSLAARGATLAVLSAVDTAVWLPSYWRHPEMACPATTWYRSVQVRGRLRPVVEVEEKAVALAAFLRRYQPEGGHLPLDEARYVAPLRALCVLALPLEEFVCKVKVGQHLTEAVRAEMKRRLEERGGSDDWKALRLMERANGMEAEYPSVDDGLLWTDGPCRAEDVHGLLSQTYWAAARPLEKVEENLRQATLTLCAWDGRRLIAHARFVAVHPKVGWLFDVVVHESYRGRGLGTALMNRLLAHRVARSVSRVFLDTRDAMAFYQRFGFASLLRSEKRNSSLMVREP